MKPNEKKEKNPELVDLKTGAIVTIDEIAGHLLENWNYRHSLIFPFFLMTMSSELSTKTQKSSSYNRVADKKVTAILHWDISDSERYEKGMVVFGKLSGSSLFPVPWSVEFGTPALINTNAGNLNAAIIALAGQAGTKESVDLMASILHKSLLSAMSMVQLKMNSAATGLDAMNICTDAGFEYKKLGSGRGARINEAIKASTPGTLILHGEGAGPHEWEQSTDGGETSIPLHATRGGENVATGLITDKRYWFRNRLILPDCEYGEWSPWYSEIAP